MRRTGLFGVALLTPLIVTGRGQSPPLSLPTASATVATASAPWSGAKGSASSDTAPSSPVFPAVPDPATALDVSRTVVKAGFASFASPSGKIWCALYADYALCHFPYDYAGRIPNSKVGYFCSEETGSTSR